MKEKILVVVLPLLLFIAKQFLPIYAKYTSSEENEKPDYSKMFAAVINEIILFPVDLVFISISWLVPKVFVDELDELAKVKAQVQSLNEQLIYTEDINSRKIIVDTIEKQTTLQNELFLHNSIGIVFCSALFIGLIFLVLQTKKAQNSLGRNRWVPTLLLYVLSLYVLYISFSF